MITRKLLAALVGLSLATGTIGTVSAQTAQPTTQSASPSDSVAPVTSPKVAPKAAAMMRKAPAKHTRMLHKTHRKLVSLRAAKGKLARHSAKHNAKLASRHVAKHGIKLASKHNAKRVRLSHVVKPATTKHV